MVNDMAQQNYVMVQDGVAVNLIVWDGNTETWPVPEGVLMLVQKDTPSKEWQYNSESLTWELLATIGTGGISYTWDGQFLITNQPKPASPELPTSQEAPSQ